MTDFLLYWKYFWEDILQDSSAFNDEWHTDQKGFYDRVSKDDNLWIVVSGGKSYPEEWRLLEKIVVQEKFSSNPPISPYGKYSIIGDSTKGQKFDVDEQEDLTDLLLKLDFESGKKITAVGRKIGNTIQTIRPLAESDKNYLRKYADKLKRHTTDSGFYEDNSINEFENIVSKATGAGFANYERRKEVEKKAVDFVENHYKSEGWKVTSVEKENLGYDLVCIKNSEEIHAEVKGISGSLQSFMITRNELNKSRSDEKFVICIVNSALSENPALTIYTGKELNENFDFSEICFQANLK